MWRFLVLVFCYKVLSQPVTEELSRHPRELIECCPCPSHGSESTLGRSSQVGRENVDDCPCRARSADSEGASSILFPSSVRPDGPHLRPFNSKEEQKNLLEPEVGLATSMLQTLHEATEEEYQDALARDAARSAASLDENAEESAKNLVIFINPRTSDDDALGEASHVQESRCIHPLGSTPLARMRTLPSETNIVPDILKFPRLRRPGLPHRNLLDMDSNVGASNVEEKVIDLNNDASVTKSKPTTLFRSNIPFKSNLFTKSNEEKWSGDVTVSKSPTSILRSNVPFKSKLFGNVNDDSDPESLSTLKSPLLSKPKIKPLFDGFRLPLLPRMSPSPLQKGNDLSPAPSVVQEVLDDPNEKSTGLAKLAKRPMILKNLWKLKDVELIPPAKLPKKPVLKLPKSTLPMLRSTNAKEDCDVKVSGETKHFIKSEVKPNELESYKSGDSAIDAGDDNCTNDTDVLNNQDQDLLHSPSNFNLSSWNSTEIPNISKERDVSSTSDLEPSPSEDRQKSIDVENTNVDENCPDASQPKLIEDSIQYDNNLDRDSIQIDTTENCETSLKDADVATHEPFDQDSFSDTSIINNVVAQPDSKMEDLVGEQSDDNGALFNPQKNSFDETNVPQNIDPVSDADLPNKMLKPIPSLSETLSAIRDNIKKLDFFINPTKTLTSEEINDDIAKYESGKTEKDSDNNSEFVTENNESYNFTDNDEEQPKSIESIDENASNSVTLEDLQKLSDDLLDSSSNQEQKTSTQTDMNVEKLDYQANLQDMPEDRKTDPDDLTNEPLPLMTQEENERSEGNLKENTCPNNLDLTSVQENTDSPQMKSTDQEIEPSEMETEASESIFSTLPNILDPLNLSDKLKSLPSPNNIVQPSLPTDPLNLLNNPLDDIIDLNPKLPTLNDIREQLSNVFSSDINEKSAKDTQEEYDYDEKEIEKMVQGASTSNSQIKLPTIKPKENSDLFQLSSTKPSQRSSLSNNPKINLNSYRAKVAVPKSIDLKPIKLESNGRSKDGILRTPLKLNTDRRPIARAKLPKSNLHLLGEPLTNLPTLDQLKDAFHTSPNRLLGNPLKPDLNLFRSNPISDFSDNIRLNAEKTMKGLQKKMRTSLKGPQISEPLAKPQEFLEDVSDKLKAIHYDLNDRLASVHDNILDTPKLQLPSTLLRTSDNLFNKNLMTNLRTAKPKPLRMQTLASSISSREVKGPEMKPIARRVDTSQLKLKTPSKLFKNQDLAASAPTPVRLERPKLGKDIDRFPLQRFNERTVPSIEPKLKSSIPKPVFRKPNFKDSRTTITFGSTTPSTLRSVDVPITTLPRMDENSFPKKIGSRLTHQPSSKSALDQRPSLSKIAQKPVEFTSKLKELENQQKENSLKLNKNLNPRTKISDANKLTSLGDVVKERFSNFDSFKHSKVPKFGSSDRSQVKIGNPQNKVTSNPDMLRSASENTDVVVRQEPLKENVSYKCRLVCTKE